MAKDKKDNSKGDYLELSTNLAADSITRQVVDGKDMLVGNVVMAVEGVMNGLFYDFDALNASVPGWNGRPVIISHPQRRGVPVTANSPELLKTHVGIVFKAFADAAGKKLKAKLYLDETKLKESDEGTELIRRLDSHEVQEVSTGLFMTREGEGGIFGEDWYEAKALNILPDHLAILLDVEGASGVDDGAGFPRLNQQAKPIPVERIRELVVHVLDERNKQMDKVKMIELILASNAGFSEADKEWLEKRSDEELTALHGRLVKNDDDVEKAKAEAAAKLKADADEKVKADQAEKANADAEKAKADADAKKKKEEDDAGGDKDPNKEPTPAANFETLLASADPATRESIAQGRRLFDERQKAIVKTIMANKDNKFTEDELVAMSFEHLEHIAVIAAPKAVFAGQGGMAANEDDDQSKMPEMPAVNWKDDQDK